MFLSKVILHPRSAAAHRILSDLYRQHQFVQSAFSDGFSVRADAEPAPTDSRPCVLYRVETFDSGRRLFLLVQSDEEPDWERGIDLHPGAISTVCTKKIEPAFTVGQALQFRLRANPTRMHVNGDINLRANHKRGGLYKEPEQLDWLERQAEQNGFHVDRDAVRVIPLGLLTGEKSDAREAGKSHTVKCLSVDFEGALTVVDPEAFLSGFQKGIGRGKAFGFGLLSLARL